MNVKFTFKGLRFNIGDDTSKLYPLQSISKNDTFPFILDTRLTDQVKIEVQNIQVRYGIDYQIPNMLITFTDDLGYIINNYMPYMTNQHIVLELNEDVESDTDKNILTYVGYIEEDPSELEDNGKGEHTLTIRPHYHASLTAPSPAKSFKNKSSSDIIREILTNAPYNIPSSNLFLDTIDNKGDWIKINGESDLDFINRTLMYPFNTKDTNYIYKFWFDMNDTVYLKSLEKEIVLYTDKDTSEGDIVYKYPATPKTKFIASSLEFKSLGANRISEYNNTKNYLNYKSGSISNSPMYADSLPVQTIIGKMSAYENTLKYYPNMYDHDLMPKGMVYGKAVKNKESLFPYQIALEQREEYITSTTNGKMYTVRTQNNAVQEDIPSVLSGGWVLFNTLFELDSDANDDAFKQTLVMKRRILK